MSALRPLRCAALVAALAPAAAEAASEPLAVEIAYVAGEHAYFARGRADGLAQGQELRGAESVKLGCRIESVAERFAVCKLPGAKAGQILQARDVAPPPAAAPVKTKIRLSRRQRARRHQALKRFRFRPVAFAGSPASGSQAPAALRYRAVAQGRHAVWAATGGARTSHAEELHFGGALRNLGWRGFGISADLSARQWTQRSNRTRYRPTSASQLEVREVAVELRHPSLPVAAQIGRLRPWHLPGVERLDGAQIAWNHRGEQGSAWELGAFGGLMPDVITSEPDPGHWIGGLYGRLDLHPSDHQLVRARAQLSLSALDASAYLLSAGLQAETRWRRSLHVAGSLRLGIPVGDTTGRLPGVMVQGVDLALNATPWRSVALFAAIRHMGSFGGWRGTVPAAAIAVDSGEATRADGGARWLIGETVELALTAGAIATTGTQGAWQGHLGPTIRLLGSLPWRAELAVGSTHLLGDAPEFELFAAAQARPLDSLRMTLRLAFATDHEVARWTDLGAATTLHADLLSWLRLRFDLGAHLYSGLSRPALGFTGGLALEGSVD